MADNISITRQINSVSAIQTVNNITVSSPGPQGPQGASGTFSVSSIPVINPITNTSGSIGYNTSYVPASATYSSSAIYSASAASAVYSSSAGISASTAQTNFTTLTLSGSSVVTQPYVNSQDILYYASAQNYSNSGSLNSYNNASAFALTAANSASSTAYNAASAFTTSRGYVTSTGSVSYATNSGSSIFANNSSSTLQTNFVFLTISGSNVATQAYVLANIPASAQYAGSANYAANAANSTTTSQTNFTSLTLSGSNVATQPYVNAQIANLVDSAPSTLDTLNELAAALGDDPNFATTTASQIGLKANTSYVDSQDQSYYASAQSYANSASLVAYNNASAFSVTQSNSASLNAYNTASTLVKTGSWNNQSASNNYSTYSGSSNYAITSVVTSDTPPSSPVSSQLWYNTATNRLFVWYVDVDSSQWVEVAGAYTPAFNAIGSDLIPNVDNYYALGSASMRWKALYLGASTLYITDTVTASNVGLTVNNGVLYISGSVQIQTGNIKITPTGITSTASAQDITIGDTGDTGYLATARGIKYPDGSIQISAAPAHNFDAYSTVDQTNPVANVVRAMTFNTINNVTNLTGSADFTITSGSIISTKHAATYNIQFTAQTIKTDAGNDDVYIWLRKDGQDVPQSGGIATITGNNGKTLASWNFVVSAAASSTFSLMWAAADTSIYLAHTASATSPYLRPGVPSTTITFTEVK